VSNHIFGHTAQHRAAHPRARAAGHHHCSHVFGGRFLNNAAARVAAEQFRANLELGSAQL
jgi:hypothetical protein